MPVPCNRNVRLHTDRSLAYADSCLGCRAKIKGEAQAKETAAMQGLRAQLAATLALNNSPQAKQARLRVYSTPPTPSASTAPRGFSARATSPLGRSISAKRPAS